MFEKETISYIVAYLKVRIAKERLEKRDSMHLNSVEVLEGHRKACSRLDAYESVLEELESFRDRRQDKRNEEKVTWTAKDEEELYTKQKAYRKKHKIPMER